jgi:hypothetical protein
MLLLARCSCISTVGKFIGGTSFFRGRTSNGGARDRRQYFARAACWLACCAWCAMNV